MSARDEGGRTGLHLAMRHPEAVQLLLSHGADPNARENGDNVTPLHLAAAHGLLESVRILLDAGADVHGRGDLHEGDVIGWAAGSRNQPVIDLLLERGARHHVFSAMALGDPALVRRVVADDPAALRRRRSRFENGQTAVHAAFAPADGIGFLCGKPDHDMLALLIELGADVHAADDRGRTPLTLAMLRGDHVAMRLLVAAGAAVDTADAATEVNDVAAPLAALSGERVAGRADVLGARRAGHGPLVPVPRLHVHGCVRRRRRGDVRATRVRPLQLCAHAGWQPRPAASACGCSRARSTRSTGSCGLASGMRLAPRSRASLAASSADSTRTSTHPSTVGGSSASATPTTCP